MPKKLLIILFCLLLVTIVSAEETIINEAAAITTDTPVIIEPTAIPTEIPILITEKHPISLAPSILLKRINNAGVVSETELKATEIDSISMVSIAVGNSGTEVPTPGKIIGKIGEQPIIAVDKPAKIITAQAFPKAQIKVSDVGDVLMQTSNKPGYPQLEIYYGYQTDAGHPWSQYYKVNGEQTTHADFNNRRVWITPTDHVKVQAILDSGAIPLWDELP